MQNLYSSLFLVIVGMGTVFLFLALLIIATEAVRRMIDTPAPAAPVAPAKAASPAAPDEATLAVVIASAVTQFRQDRNGK
ncbi:MAG: OadG family protein [Nitrospirae bacterium]|nr:OadG family protein [Nitrospirota bacterium]